MVLVVVLEDVLEIVLELVIVSVHLVLVKVLVLCRVEVLIVLDKVLTDVTVHHVITVVEAVHVEEGVLVGVKLFVIIMGAIRHVLVIVMVYVDKVAQLEHLDVEVLLVRPQDFIQK